MKKSDNIRYRITLFYKKTGNIFEVYYATTKKECEKMVKQKKLEMRNWCKNELKPTGVNRSWVIIQ